ncbi:hypothetical protein NE237_004306 [Protea cynaroides]|uniref:U-box domain-containing protein n=1 Tax=Protea cynaroides TaxID=273540 RepID=A0A9Q0KIL8_9MAGN|nr:hypothetical protein NE237_004306 [Protea cynaroides]
MKILSEIMDVAGREDQYKWRDLVMNIKNEGKESDPNKKCIKANGAGRTLAAVFRAFVAISFEKHSGLLEEILSALTLIFPLDAEAGLLLGSPDSLICIVRLLKSGDLFTRRNTIFRH